ncbi:hypothetical protein [Bowmanella sp. JS7-9]|uniref:Uncharacterized protein n=1 Tax=Pseudobowmanella zhangzhouensis TaxID=1537679 RepID=A0ABW1XKR3_9ALTE|nr:hypothetical protein [Bowmanella sp. JS7-9]TBX24563.1 hypothetical protein TK45_04655 [Bowmanella sp. JS7-9]
MLQISKADKFGSFTLHYANQVLHAEVHGVCGLNLAQYFVDAVNQIVEQIDDPYWGYLGDLSALDGFNQQALDIIFPAHRLAIAKGCVVDAYCFDSPLTRTQIQLIRSSAGIQSSLNERVFHELGQANAYLRQQLASISQYSRSR